MKEFDKTLISKTYLKELEYAMRKLTALESADVCDWKLYDLVMREFLKKEKENANT